MYTSGVSKKIRDNIVYNIQNKRKDIAIFIQAGNKLRKSIDIRIRNIYCENAQKMLGNISKIPKNVINIDTCIQAVI